VQGRCLEVAESRARVSFAGVDGGGSDGRGRQGRPVRAARRGDLRARGLVAASHPRARTAPWVSPWPAYGWTQRTFTIALTLSWTTEMLGDRPFLRAGSHGVFRPQPDGLIQLNGLATLVGAMAILELASWLCPSLLTRPPYAGCGSRRRAARSR
jgi:hypothetical protein